MASVASPEATTRKATAAAWRRKSRVPKSCYPCYRRKVRCDRKSPCTLCLKRGYPRLCTYTHPVKDKQPAKSLATSQTSPSSHSCNNAFQKMACRAPKPTVQSGNVVVDTKEWRGINNRLLELSQCITTLRSRMELPPFPPASEKHSPLFEDDRSPNTTCSNTSGETLAGGVRMRNALGGSPVHCGSDSVLAFLLRKPRRSIFHEDSVLSQLGLENHLATYPFLDLWSSNITSYNNEAVCAALPEDSICLRLLRSYRDVRMILYPVISDFDRFEADARMFIEKRSLSTITVAQSRFNMAFVGMLFAVLASGCQVSDLSKHERTSMCQRYISSAYQCLRNSNFLSLPTMESVQTLLIIGDALSYEMNPGVAYMVFGLAQRMALTLGLHTESALFTDPGAYRRQQLWWSMAWQDSHFGLSYDRPVETLSPSPQIPRPQGSRPGMRGYFETMCSVISLILQLLRNEILLGDNVSDDTIPAYKADLAKILADAEPYLQSEDYCFTLRDHIERLTLKLRSSYLVSEICRRSLKQNNTSSSSTTASRLCHECVDSLIGTVEAYIELHEIIPRGSRSWIHLHSAISSAFLLSVDEGGQSDPEVLSILKRLEKVLTALTTSLDRPDNIVCHSPESKTEWSPVGYSANGIYAQNSHSPEPDILSASCGNPGSTTISLPFGLELISADSPVSFQENATDTGPGFLIGTLSSLRKIIAGLDSRKADGKKTEVEKAGPCCSSRCAC